MSLKSLGTASLGLLSRGVNETLHIASLGLLRDDGVLEVGNHSRFFKGQDISKRDEAEIIDIITALVNCNDLFD